MKNTFHKEILKSQQGLKFLLEEDLMEVSQQQIELIRQKNKFRSYLIHAERIENGLKKYLHQSEGQYHSLNGPQLKDQYFIKNTTIMGKQKDRKEEQVLLESYRTKVIMYEKLMQKLFRFIQLNQEIYPVKKQADGKINEKYFQQEIQKYKAELLNLKQYNQALLKKNEELEWLLESYHSTHMKSTPQQTPQKQGFQVTASQLIWQDPEQLNTKVEKKELNFDVLCLETVKISKPKQKQSTFKDRKFQVKIYNVEATDLRDQIFQKDKQLERYKRQLEQMKNLCFTLNNLMGANKQILKYMIESCQKIQSTPQISGIISHLKLLEVMMEFLLKKQNNKNYPIDESMKIKIKENVQNNNIKLGNFIPNP